MEYIPGSIEITNNESYIDVGEFLNDTLKMERGLFGFRFPSVGVAEKSQIPTFIMICDNAGIIIIDVIAEHIVDADETYEWWTSRNNQDLYSSDLILDQFESEIINRLKRDRSLYDRKEKRVKVVIQKVLLFLSNSKTEVENLDLTNNAFFTKEALLPEIKDFIQKNSLSNENSKKLYSILEGTNIFEKKRKFPTTELRTMEDFIGRSLKQTFKLDSKQRRVAMQLPSGPQRIRGLAGTGKTVILALKASIAHKENENYKILYVFNTQSMYQHVRGLISKHYTYEARKEVNWDNVQVFHAWGGRRQPGLYSTICTTNGITPFNFQQVRNKIDPYEYIFSDLLMKVKDNITPIYDMVLIDEAQDFPQSFFELIYYLTKHPKRIIWAYDEFQSLNEIKIKEPSELFGYSSEHKPNIPNEQLNGSYLGGINKDFILSNCYRNPRFSLMVAHGLGLGIYRKDGIIDIPSDNFTWDALGYNVETPEKQSFQEGDEMKIIRPESNSKNILEKLLKENNTQDTRLVKVKEFEESKKEYDSLVKQIIFLIEKHNIQPEQIVVISLASRNTKNIFNYIEQLLDESGIKSLTPGYNYTSSSSFQEKGFITLTTPFRAKGNEADVVFVIDTQSVISDISFKARSAIFVAVTRARGWCYISGSGSKMSEFKEEFDKIKNDYPYFNFLFPKESDIERRRIILNTDEQSISKVDKKVSDVLESNIGMELLIERIKMNPELLEKIRNIQK